MSDIDDFDGSPGPVWGDPDAALEFDTETFRWVGRTLAATGVAGTVLAGAVAVIAAKKTCSTVRGRLVG